MAVWEHTEVSLAEVFVRSVLRMMTLVFVIAILVGPVLAGGWAANAYIDYRTNSDGLKLTLSEKSIPSPTELIRAVVNDASSLH